MLLERVILWRKNTTHFFSKNMLTPDDYSFALGRKLMINIKAGDSVHRACFGDLEVEVVVVDREKRKERLLRNLI